MTAHNALGMKQPGTKIDPYIKMTLGTHKKAPTEKSKVKKKQKNAFSLDDEVITLILPIQINLFLKTETMMKLL